MTTLTLELVAEVARIETEERVRRAQRRREAAASGGLAPGIGRRIAGSLFARAPRLPSSPPSGTSDTLQPAKLASSRATTS